ncbi:MAG TPA: hypothetical protein VH641_16675 [Streptosporangiaceae bacterium]|jgi:hypothetical protein
MHPYLIEQLAATRQRDLRAAARQTARPRPTVRRRPHRGSARHRAGWFLVEVGLRLAGGPGGA